jgi:malate dehydrogenase
MVRAVADNTNEVHPVSAWVDGPYGISGVYVGVPAKLGRDGVTEVVELELAEEELAALRTAAEAVGAKQAEVLDLLA